MKLAEALPSMVVPWTARDAAKAIVLVAVGALVLALTALLVARLLADPKGASTLFLPFAVQGVLLLALWRFGPWRYGRSWSALGLRRTLNNGAPLALLAVASSVGFAVFYSMAVTFLGLDSLRPPQLPSQLLDTYAERLAMFTLAGVVAPVVEEAFFRGFLLPAFLARWGFVPGASLVSLLFAMSHGVLALLIPAFVSGLLLAWLYRRTGSLWNCVLAHGAQNAIAFAVAVSV